MTFLISGMVLSCCVTSSHRICDYALAPRQAVTSTRAGERLCWLCSEHGSELLLQLLGTTNVRGLDPNSTLQTPAHQPHPGLGGSQEHLRRLSGCVWWSGALGVWPCHAAVFFHHRPLDGNTCLSQVHSWAPLQVLHGDSEVLFPVSGVGSYGPAGRCSLFLFQ